MKYTTYNVQQLSRKGKPWQARAKYKDADGKWKEVSKMLPEAKGKKEAMRMAKEWFEQLNAEADLMPNAGKAKTVDEIYKEYLKHQLDTGEIERSTYSNSLYSYNKYIKHEFDEVSTMYIETDRMVIRDFTMDDLNDMHDIFGDAETMKNCEPAYTIEKTADFLQKFCIDKNGAVAAVHKETNKVIGYILFKEYDEEVYEIGWIYNKDYWRQGYAFESCKAVMDYAFNSMNVHKVFAEAIDGIKSVGLMKKLGMKLEGIQRSQTKDNFGNWADLYFYGILAEDRQ